MSTFNKVLLQYLLFIIAVALVSFIPSVIFGTENTKENFYNCLIFSVTFYVIRLDVEAKEDKQNH